MLCSSIVNDLLQMGQGKDVVTFFVSTEAFSGMDTARYVLDSLICQLVRAGTRTAPRSQLLTIQRSIDLLGSRLSADKFRQYLGLVLDTLKPGARLVVALDGLQTDEWIANALVYELLEANTVRSKSNHIRCVITSKAPHSVISHHDQVVSIDISSKVGVQHDIFVFAKARLALYPQPMTEDGTYLEAKAKQLSLRANGSFLWIQMVTENQDRSRNLEEVLKDIDTLPSSLQGLYAVMLQKVPAWCIHIVRIVFSWLLAAIRPLKLGELVEALIIESVRHRASVSEAYAIERLGLQDPKTDIPKMCRGLVCTFRN